MKRFIRCILPAATSLGLLFGVSALAARGEEPGAAKPAASQRDGKGTISGKVVDADGKGVAEVQVSLVKPPARETPETRREARGEARAREARAERRAQRQRDAGAEARKPATGPRKRPEPVATTKTDAEGRFTFKDVAAGNYAVRAQLRGQGAAAARVTVAAGKPAEIAMTLNKRPVSGDRSVRGKPAPTPEQQAQREQRRQERREEKQAAKNQL